MQLTGTVAINAEVTWHPVVSLDKTTQVWTMAVTRNDGEIVQIPVFMGDWINAGSGRLTAFGAFFRELHSRAIEQAHSAVGVTINVKPADIPADQVVIPATQQE